MASIFLANEWIKDNNIKILNIYFVCIMNYSLNAFYRHELHGQISIKFIYTFQNYKLVRQSIIGRIMEKNIFCLINIG